MFEESACGQGDMLGRLGTSLDRLTGAMSLCLGCWVKDEGRNEVEQNAGSGVGGADWRLEDHV